MVGAASARQCRAIRWPRAPFPHLANDQGVEKIFIGVRELNCMGARPPFDHPHVYLDMGDDGQILCPYCSTLYIYDPRLSTDQSDPAGCLVSLGEDAA
ncbi:MAG: zinc-finger domain-containing protein [Hyphomicrobium sp.]|nr:zinc-finger domain-containing protein [Hyphomicrobium sp.]